MQSGVYRFLVVPSPQKSSPKISLKQSNRCGLIVAAAHVCDLSVFTRPQYGSKVRPGRCIRSPDGRDGLMLR